MPVPVRIEENTPTLKSFNFQSYLRFVCVVGGHLTHLLGQFRDEAPYVFTHVEGGLLFQSLSFVFASHDFLADVPQHKSGNIQSLTKHLMTDYSEEEDGLLSGSYH